MVLVICILKNPPMAATWEALLIVLVLAGTVLRPTTLIGHFLESGPMEWIGRMSYSLYIWQQLFLVESRVPRPLPLGRWQEFPLNILPVFGCALISYHAIERPLIKVGHRIAKPATPGRRDVKS
jgi:peptidoglycan/LPS O-acetylase OafA/YrhL